MTPSERLLKRIREMGVDVPDGARIQRTYAGRTMRSGGAWSWFVVGPDGRALDIGSQHPVKVLLAEKRLCGCSDYERYDVEINPWFHSVLTWSEWVEEDA